MRERRQQAIAQPFGFHPHQGVLGHFHKMHPLQGQGDLAGQGFQHTCLFRQEEQSLLARLQGQHTARAHGRFQR